MATPWSKLYGTERWRRRSRLNLRMHPLCAECTRQGKTREANLSHHLEEYRESFSNYEFWYGPLESLCFEHHARIHGYNVAREYSTAIGHDGYPLDPLHPFWVEDRRQQEQERKWKEQRKRS